MASDIFHKISFPGEDRAHQLDHELIKLGTDFDLVGDGFNDLIADALKISDASQHKHLAGVKYEDALIKHDVDTIGSDFLKLGDAFLKLDDVQHKFDDAFLAFSDQFIKFTPGLDTDQGGIKLHFSQLETDLSATSDSAIKLGLDFLKLDDTHTENPLGALVADLHKIDDNLGSVGDDFAAIGSDFLKLGELKLDDVNVGGIKFDSADLLKIDEAFTSLGTDAIKIGADFHKVSVDFSQISSDLAQSSDDGQPTESLSLNFSKIVFANAKDFAQLETDTHTLNLDLKLLGTDYIKLADALPAVQAPGSPDEPPGSPDHPVGSLSLDQILHLVHNFSLL